MFKQQHEPSEEASKFTRVDLEIYAQQLLHEYREEQESERPDTSEPIGDEQNSFDANRCQQEICEQNSCEEREGQPTTLASPFAISMNLAFDTVQLLPEEMVPAPTLKIDPELLLTRINRKVHARRRCQRMLLMWGGLTFLISLRLLTNQMYTDFAYSCFLFCSVITMFAVMHGVRLHRQLASLATELPDSDPRAVGPWLEMLQYAGMEGRPRRALRELLPRLQPEDAALLNDLDRTRLYRALGESDVEIAALVLDALERMGDGRAIPAVKWLAEGGGIADSYPNIRNAAIRCLPILEARSVYDTANQMLLRASSRNAEVGEELLRSASSEQSANEVDELLHVVLATESVEIQGDLSDTASLE